MEDEAETEDIANRRVLGLHILDIDDLRRNVTRRSASHEQVLLRIRELSQSVIGNHALITINTPEQNILRLEVAMHDVLGVHFLESLQNAKDHQLDLGWFELFLGLDREVCTLIFSKSCPPSSSSKMM